MIFLGGDAGGTDDRALRLGAVEFPPPAGRCCAAAGLASTGSRVARGEKIRRRPGPLGAGHGCGAPRPPHLPPTFIVEKKTQNGRSEKILLSLQFRGRLKLRLGVLPCLRSDLWAKGDVSVFASYGQICMLCCCILALPRIWLRNIFQSVPSLHFLAPRAGNIQADFLNTSNFGGIISPPSKYFG